MQLDINNIIELFTEKIAQKEKENVLLQAQVIHLQRQIEELEKNNQEVAEEFK